ncbi:MAG: F0F1 ATP synthase subunit A [Halanaerobiaceae bacterium]|nr:F0F1 ATP synthase subunit A [Halanaerobiaceae bacterium]
MQPGPKVLAYFLGNENFPITDTLVASWLAVIILILFARLLKGRLNIIPGRLQSGVEILLSFIEGQIESMIPGSGRKLLPFIGTIFLFVGISTIMGLIPGLVNPTGDINTTLGMALMVFFFSQYLGIKKAGIKNYVKGFFEPIFLMFPMNVLGELAKPISHSFRLFGNVVGGGIIITLLYQFFPWLVPVPLHFWFDLFSAFIQVLIFGMIAISYISVAVSD